jgi:hypothetical protein
VALPGCLAGLVRPDDAPVKDGADANADPA